MIKTCELKDCTKAANKCKECDYEATCDFPWVASIWQQNSDLLTPLMPAWAKASFKEHKIMTITGTDDFCIFNVPRTKDTVTIQDICVGEKARGKGISKQILKALMDEFDRDIVAKCVKDSSAEAFWSHIGEKIGEEPSKKRTVCIYRVENKNKKAVKQSLF